MNARSRLAVAGTSIVWATGCWTVYGLDKYTTARDAAAPSSSALEPSPTSGGQEASVPDAGPASCDAEQTASPAAACTSAICVPFQNSARIQGYVPGAPLPAGSKRE